MAMRVALLLALVSSCCYAENGKPLRLAENGRSAFVIYTPPDASASVKLAAEELRTYVQKVSGVTLPVTHRFPPANAISLGIHDHLTQFGLTAENIKPEGYRIAAAKGHLFIFGPGTGTLNGVYTFLEDYVGVRWFMPGELGEHVPKRPTVSIPAISRTDAPSFENRRVPYIQNRRPVVTQWSRRNKLGYSLMLHHRHNWRHVVKANLYDKHPEYFAEMGGRRIKPVKRYKVCTTNRDVINRFAQAAFRWFAQSPDRTMFSLSPSDSAGWCMCDRCRALDETDGNGKRRITRRILTFYNEVAKIVSRKFPDRKLGGYVYADYVFPPMDSNFKVHPNVFLVWAPSFNYGPQHYRPATRKLWHETLWKWRAFTPNLAYYDLPAWFRTTSCAPNPPCRSILKSMFPALKKAGIRGVYIYGRAEWGHAAALNYLLARLAWNADGDVDALADEFYDKFYGKAGPSMKALYGLVEERIERHYRATPHASYTLTSDGLRNIYVPVFPRMEALYLKAAADARSEAVRKRLEMFKQTMIVLCYRLHGLNMLPNAEKSVFFRSEKAFAQFAKTTRESLALLPIRDFEEDKAARRTVTSVISTRPFGKRIPVAEPLRPFVLRNSQHIVIQTSQDKDVHIAVDCKMSRKVTRPPTYSVHSSTGARVARGKVGAKTDIRFFASDGERYHLFLKGSGFFSLRMPDVLYAVDGRGRLHFLGKTTPVYFYVPRGVKSFSLALASEPPGETAVAKLYDPQNRQVASFRTVETPVDCQRIKRKSIAGGFWKLVPEKAEKGTLDDVLISVEGLSGFFSLEPNKLLIVERRE